MDEMSFTQCGGWAQPHTQDKEFRHPEKARSRAAAHSCQKEPAEVVLAFD